MIRSRLFFLFALSFSLVLGSCGSSEQSPHFSDSGLIPEAYMPQDLVMLVSYSTREPGQFEALQNIGKILGDDDRVSRVASETFQAQLNEAGLDFEEDLRPAFGEQFRLFYGVRSPEAEVPESFTVVTLENPAKMKEALEALTDANELSFKQLSGLDAYINAENHLYITVKDDLLFASSKPENLIAMLEMKEADSLWKQEAYQDLLKDMGPDYVLYAVLYPAAYPSGGALSPSSLLSSLADEQVFVLRAESKGLAFDVWTRVDKALAKEAGFRFDAAAKSEPYLYKEIPSDGLLAYYESYGLKQSFDQAQLLDQENALGNLQELVRNYFGMDLADVLSFMDKGGALMMHQVEGNIVPGITLYFDVSSDAEAAEDFVNKLDGQLSGILLILEQALPGAISKDTVNWNGAEYKRLKVDLAALPESQENPLPDVLKTSTLQLVYGVHDERLLLSTASTWDETGESLPQNESYKAMESHLDGGEGLVFLDAQELAQFLTSLQALGEDGLGADGQHIEDFLDGFLGAIGQGKTEDYESHFSGFLMLKGQ